MARKLDDNTYAVLLKFSGSSWRLVFPSKLAERCWLDRKKEYEIVFKLEEFRQGGWKIREVR